MTVADHARKTDKGNTFVHGIWLTHHDTAWGPYLGGASLKPWDDDYDAPITQWADNTRFVNAELYEELKAENEALQSRLALYEGTTGKYVSNTGVIDDLAGTVQALATQVRVAEVRGMRRAIMICQNTIKRGGNAPYVLHDLITAADNLEKEYADE